MYIPMKAMVSNSNLPSNVRGSIGNRKENWSRILKYLILVLFFQIAIWSWASYFISPGFDFHVHKMGLIIYAHDQDYFENHCLSENLFKTL